MTRLIVKSIERSLSGGKTARNAGHGNGLSICALACIFQLRHNCLSLAIPATSYSCTFLLISTRSTQFLSSPLATSPNLQSKRCQDTVKRPVQLHQVQTLSYGVGDSDHWMVNMFTIIGVKY